MTDVDFEAASRCARIVLALFAGRTPPRWLMSHYRDLELITATGGFPRETSRTDVGTEWISTAEAARILEVSAQYVRRIATSLGGRRVTGNTWIFDRKDVEHYATQRDRRRSGRATLAVGGTARPSELDSTVRIGY
jgi:hypothetical protein